MKSKDEFMKDIDKIYKRLKRLRKRLKKRQFVSFIPLLLTFLLAGVFIYSLTSRFDSDAFAGTYTNYMDTVVIMLAFFAFKALTLFVISPVLIYGLTGVMFDTTIAIVVLIAGLLLELSINYLMGKFLGRIYVERLVLRIDDEGRLMDKLRNVHNNRMNIFLMRFIGVPPIGITSVYLAAMGLGFKKYLLYSLLGLLPKAILITIAGASIRNPMSPVFIVSVLCLFIFGAVFYIMSRSKNLK